MKRQVSNLIHPHAIAECSKADDSFAANFNSRKSVTRGHGKPNIATIESHKDKVFAVAVCGDLLYTAGESKDIRVFRAPMFEELDCFGSGSGAVQSLMAFEEHLYSAHQDNMIRVWKRVKSTDDRRCKHKLVTVLPRLEHCVKSMLLERNYVQIRRHKRKLWIQHADTISALALGGSRSSAEGGGHGGWSPPSVLYSASWDKTVKVWSLNNFKCLESFYAHHDAINAIIVIEGSILATASADGTIKLWTKTRRTKKHGLINTLQGHQAAVNALAISGDNKVLYSGGSDGTLMAWKKVYSCKGMKGSRASSLSVKQRSQEIISTGISGEVSIGSSTGSEENIIVSRENSITTSHGLSSIKKVINNHNRLHALNSVNFIMKKALLGHTRAVLSVSTVGDNIVCSSSADSTIRAWLRRGRSEKGARWEYACIAVLVGHGGPVKAIASVSPAASTAPIIMMHPQEHLHPAAAAALDPQLAIKEEEEGEGEEAGVVVYSGGLDSKVKVWALNIPRYGILMEKINF